MEEQANNNPERKFSQEQYDMLKRCSDAKNMTEWNEWRQTNPNEVIWLEGIENSDFPYLKKADLKVAYLKKAKLSIVHLEGAELYQAHLEGVSFLEAHLEDADLAHASVQGANFRRVHANGSTSFWRIKVNRYTPEVGECYTDFAGVALGDVRIDSGTKQLLEYNIRRRSWEDWYKEHKFKRLFVKPFWALSDYGRSTGRILFWFFVLAFAFALVHWGWGCIDSWQGYEGEPGIIKNLFVIDETVTYTFDGEGSMLPNPIETVMVPKGLAFCRAIYFSVVTMTTLGFGDMYAQVISVWGHVLLTFQVLLGYVMLGALVTRFAVLFTAGGPAGEFADE